MAMVESNGDGTPRDWRESEELMQMRESAASVLASVERLLMAQGMPPEKRLLLTRTERRRVLATMLDRPEDMN